MLKKTLKLIVAFPTTSEALKMEKVCRNNSIKGKLIPIPREISAGCGMAWSSEIELKEDVLKLIMDNNIAIDKTYEIFK